MTKKEICLFALSFFILIITFFLPRLLVSLGEAADSLDAFTADSNGVLYLATDRIIHIVQRDGKTKSIPSPFNGAVDSLKKEDRNLVVSQNRKYAVVDMEGTVLERGQIPSNERIDSDQLRRSRYQPKNVGESQYRLRSCLGIYWVTEQTMDIKQLRYRISFKDAVIIVMEIKSFLDLFILIILWNIYFIANGRFAKNGTILPPGYQGDDSFDLF